MGWLTTSGAVGVLLAGVPTGAAGSGRPMSLTAVGTPVMRGLGISRIPEICHFVAAQSGAVLGTRIVPRAFALFKIIDEAVEVGQQLYQARLVGVQAAARGDAGNPVAIVQRYGVVVRRGGRSALRSVFFHHCDGRA